MNLDRLELPDVAKPASIRELGPVDMAPFDALLSSWTDRFWAIENDRKPNKFAIFDTTEHIVLRYRSNQGDPSTVVDHPLWALASPSLLPSLQPAIGACNCKQPTIALAMFARLDPHSRIERHTDSSATHRLTHKIHVPIITHPDVSFHVGSTDVHLERGRAYEVNNLASHGTTNPTDERRVHFIFELFDRPNE